MTGNVFFVGDRAPTFVDCDQLRTDGRDVVLTCYGADRCVEGTPCDASGWRVIATITLALSFFEPPDGVGPPPGCLPYSCPVDGAQVCFDQLPAEEQRPYDFGAVSTIASRPQQSVVNLGNALPYVFNDPGHRRREPDGTIVLEDSNPAPIGFSCGNVGGQLTFVRVTIRPEACGGSRRAGSFEFVAEGGCRISGQFAVTTFVGD